MLPHPVQAPDLCLQLREERVFQTQLPTKDRETCLAERTSLLSVEMCGQARDFEVAGQLCPCRDPLSVVQGCGGVRERASLTVLESEVEYQGFPLAVGRVWWPLPSPPGSLPWPCSIGLPTLLHPPLLPSLSPSPQFPEVGPRPPAAVCPGSLSDYEA